MLRTVVSVAACVEAVASAPQHAPLPPMLQWGRRLSLEITTRVQSLPSAVQALLVMALKTKRSSAKRQSPAVGAPLQPSFWAHLQPGSRSTGEWWADYDYGDPTRQRHRRRRRSIAGIPTLPYVKRKEDQSAAKAAESTGRS